jgi:hypothetical protein
VKDFGLKQYFDDLGRSVSGGKVDFDVGKYECDENAAHDLQAEMDYSHARDFLWEDLSRCGDFVTTYDPTALSTLLCWWAWEPRTIARRFRAKLQSMLLEAGLKVKPNRTKAKTAATTKLTLPPPFNPG